MGLTLMTLDVAICCVSKYNSAKKLVFGQLYY